VSIDLGLVQRFHILDKVMDLVIAVGCLLLKKRRSKYQQ
jgi:hypothetical protein